MDKPNSQVTHFVILTHPRSGSTMIATALGSHKRVTMYHEIFNDDQETRKKDFPADLRVYDSEADTMRIFRRKRYYRDGECGEKFLREAVFYPRWVPGPLAVGFKLFYEHASSPKARRAWDYIDNHEQIRIIHLLRADPLQSWISLKTAERTGIWALDRNQRTSEGRIDPFVGSVESCVNFVQDILRCRASTRDRFRKHRTFEIMYERDLCQNYTQSMAMVQRFLKIPFKAMHPVTVMQRSYKPAQILLNYEQLRSVVDEIINAEATAADAAEYVRVSTLLN